VKAPVVGVEVEVQQDARPDRDGGRLLALRTSGKPALYRADVHGIELPLELLTIHGLPFDRAKMK
jgi:hypothetical protein